jgi:hypothetical protein
MQQARGGGRITKGRQEASYIQLGNCQGGRPATRSSAQASTCKVTWPPEKRKNMNRISDMFAIGGRRGSGGHEPQDQRRGREDGSLRDFSLLSRDKDRDTRPATVHSINFNSPHPTNSSSCCHEDEQNNDISHLEFCTGELYILSGIYAEWENLNWKSNIIQQQQFLELSQIVPQQEEVTKC